MRNPLKLSKLSAVLTIGLTLGLGVGVQGVTQAQTVTAVMQAPLRSLDPIITTAYLLQNYGYLVYDTLVRRDSEGKIQPQMLDHWKASADGKTYTFTLRSGLKWHDGTPVTAADCVASIKRWGAKDSLGQLMMGHVTSMEAVDANNFTVTLDTPSDIVLRALAKESPSVPFMMPESVANTPITKAITSTIGSGPFVFDAKEYKPGVQAVFLKNKDYVPRQEPADGNAGGHVVNVDKVRWASMPDSMTAVNALRNGEVDILERIAIDLIPLVEQGNDVSVLDFKTQRGQEVMRLNHLIPPFNNKKIRQAALAAVDQAQVLKAIIGNQKYYRTCAAVFGCETPYATEVGAEHLVKADPELSKKLLKEAGYDGTAVTLLQATDFPVHGNAAQVVAQQLRAGGFNVTLQPLDWQSVLQRRAVKKPVADGGWNVFFTALVYPDFSDPLNDYAIAANGEKAWFGWPSNAQLEELREKLVTVSDPQEQVKLAHEMQKLVLDDVVVIPLGEYSRTMAARNSLKDILEVPTLQFWNMKKVSAK